MQAKNLTLIYYLLWVSSQESVLPGAIVKSRKYTPKLGAKATVKLKKPYH